MDGRTPSTTLPGAGLVVVQVDGMSRPILERFLADGTMPAFAELLRSGRLALGDWTPLVPPCTPASQAGILHGRNDDVPGFRWFEKAQRRLMVANHVHDAAEIERRTSKGDGLLERDGASVGNLLAGDAPFSHLTMATMEDDRERRGPADSARFTLDARRWARIFVGSIAEVAQEAVDARRQRTRDVRPRIPRGVRFAVERAITNVALRMLSVDLVRRELALGRDVVYVDFTGYDEMAHHCGPGRPETVSAAARIDRSLREIVEAIDGAQRPYHLVVLSDHGQSLGWTFRQRYGVTLEAFIAAHGGGGRTYHGATEPVEYGNGLTRVVHHAAGHRLGPALAGLLERRPGSSHSRASRVIDSHGASLASPADAEEADVVLCASGNLGLVYLTDIPGVATAEDLEAHHPGLISALVAHPGVGLIVLRTAHGVEAKGRGGTRNLDTGELEGEDPLALYGPFAAEGLRRVARFSNSGDVIAIGRYDPETDLVVSFEELVGSHGGLGGGQGEPFLAHPPAWVIDRPLIGAPAVHDQLVRWLAAQATPTRTAATHEEPERAMAEVAAP